MDLEKGLKRLTLALFILAGACVVIYLAKTNETVAIIVFLIVILFHEGISYYAARYIFGLIRWVGNRFSVDKPKDEKDKEDEEENGLCETHGLTNSKPMWIPNWKQMAVLVVATLIFYGLYKHFISKYSVIIIIAIAAAFFCFAIFVSSIFRDKKQAIEYMSERKKSCSDDSKREVNNR